MIHLRFFLIFLKGSFLSFGGMGNLPILHADLVPLHFATDRQFAEALMIGQISPGPAGLWAISLGFMVDGFTGALLATAAITIPPLLIIYVQRLYRKLEHILAVEGFIRGMGLGVVGVFVVVIARLLQNGSSSWLNCFILVSAWGMLKARAPIPLILALAGIAGIVILQR